MILYRHEDKEKFTFIRFSMEKYPIGKQKDTCGGFILPLMVRIRTTFLPFCSIIKHYIAKPFNYNGVMVD